MLVTMLHAEGGGDNCGIYGTIGHNPGCKCWACPVQCMYMYVLQVSHTDQSTSILNAKESQRNNHKSAHCMRLCNYIQYYRTCWILTCNMRSAWVATRMIFFPYQSCSSHAKAVYSHVRHIITMYAVWNIELWLNIEGYSLARSELLLSVLWLEFCCLS